MPFYLLLGKIVIIFWYGKERKRIDRKTTSHSDCMHAIRRGASMANCRISDITN